MADETINNTDKHDENIDSILNEAILTTSTDNLSSDTINSISQDSLFPTRQNSGSRAISVTTVNDNLPAVSMKQNHLLYSLLEKKTQLIKKDDGASNLKKFKHDLFTTNINKDSPISNKTDNVGPKNEEFMTNSLEESNIWPALTILDQNLSESDENTSRESHEIVNKLYESYNYSPRSFTEHLITILEETTTDFLEKPNDSVSPGLAKLLNDDKCNGQVLDDESVPQNFILSSTGSAEATNEICTNLTELSTITADSLDEVRNEFTTNSTKYVSLEALSGKTRNVTHSKIPQIVINDKSTENDSAAASPGSSSTILRNTTYRKTPKIIVNPATPQNKGIASLNTQLPRETNDDDEYLTADSENESDDQETLAETSSTLKNVNTTVNMSKIVFHHNEWLNTYEKVSSYKPSNVGSPSKVPDRKVNISNYTNKLKKRSLEELAKKRQTCFDMVDQMLKKNTAKSSVSESESASSHYERETQFLNILMACSEYLNYITTHLLEPKTSKKKNRRSISKSPLNSNRKSLSHPRFIHNVTKKTSRKSLERKGQRIKLPGSMGTNSPERSIGNRQKGATPEIDKSSIRPVRELRMIYSPPRSIGNRQKGATPEMDRSSIRPVRELRMIYSPRRATFGTKIPLPKPLTWKSYIPQSSKASNAIREPNVRGPRSAKKFKHVKSPIREYIRREYKKPVLSDT